MGLPLGIGAMNRLPRLSTEPDPHPTWTSNQITQHLDSLVGVRRQPPTSGDAFNFIKFIEIKFYIGQAFIKKPGILIIEKLTQIVSYCGRALIKIHAFGYAAFRVAKEPEKMRALRNGMVRRADWRRVGTLGSAATARGEWGGISQPSWHGISSVLDLKQMSKRSWRPV